MKGTKGVYVSTYIRIFSEREEKPDAKTRRQVAFCFGVVLLSFPAGDFLKSGDISYQSVG